uniref:Uncharacterized protein n=1 Tax=Arundo donax TaxID=35708 RepID=A0A0A9CWS9_ARUDO
MSYTSIFSRSSPRRTCCLCTMHSTISIQTFLTNLVARRRPRCSAAEVRSTTRLGTWNWTRRITPNGANSGNATQGHQGYTADPIWTSGAACSRLDWRVITGGCRLIWCQIRLCQKG